MTRSRSSHLNAKEMDGLYADLRRGNLTIGELARKYDVSERVIYIHRAACRGYVAQCRETPVLRGATKITQLCLVDGCMIVPAKPARFCEAHQPVLPVSDSDFIKAPTKAMLMGGR